MSVARSDSLTKALIEIDAIKDVQKQVMTVKLNLAKFWGKVEASKVYSIDKLHFYLECYFCILDKYASLLTMHSPDIFRKKIKAYANLGYFLSGVHAYEDSISLCNKALAMLDEQQENNTLIKLSLLNMRMFAYIKLKDLPNAIKDAAYIDQTLIDLGEVIDRTASSSAEPGSTGMKPMPSKLSVIASDFNNNLSVLFKENIKSDVTKLVCLPHPEYKIPEGGLLVGHYNKTGFLEDAVYFFTKSIGSALSELDPPNNDFSKFVLAAKHNHECVVSRLRIIEGTPDPKQKRFEVKVLLNYLMSCLHQTATHNDEYAWSVANIISHLINKYKSMIEEYKLLSIMDRFVIHCHLATLHQLNNQFEKAAACFEKAQVFFDEHAHAFNDYIKLRLLVMKLTLFMVSKNIPQVIQVAISLQALIEELELADLWEEVVRSNFTREFDFIDLVDADNKDSHVRLSLDVIKEDVQLFFKLVPKEAIFESIIELDIDTQRKVLNKILLGDGILALGFWQKRGDKECRVESGMLKRIVDHLAMLDGRPTNTKAGQIGKLLDTFFSNFIHTPKAVSSSSSATISASSKKTN